MTDPIAQIFDVVYYIRQAPDFIRANELWKGYWKKGWIAKGTVFLAALTTIIFVVNIKESAEKLIAGIDSISSTSLGIVMNEITFQGGIKYIMLILLEMLIFHFSTRTVSILEEKEIETTSKDFVNAQVRMIKISIRNYCLEIIISIIIGIALSFASLSIFKSCFVLIIQFYFIGFAFMDNFFEQKGLSIKESGKYIREHGAAAVIIGGFSYLLFMIPLLGALVSPLICSVAATMYLHFKSNRDLDAELAGDLNLEIS